MQEHIRESKESKLDEMGRNSKGRSRENISRCVKSTSIGDIASINLSLSLSLPHSLLRQKHSQTSLQILDDVYYREAVPISSQSSKEKEHSILRRHGDMSQTQLCDDGESSSTATATHEMLTKAAIASVPQASACDMGCQTR